MSDILSRYRQVGRHWTTGWHWTTVIPFPQKLVSITVISQDVCVLDCSLKVSVPQPHNLWNVPTTFDFLFLPKQQFSNGKIWCLETKLWSKVIFSQLVQGYAETSVWFAHVTDCYYSGKRNSNKFFRTTKFSFVQSSPILQLMGWLWTTLGVFIWQKRMCNELVVFAFGKERL